MPAALMAARPAITTISMAAPITTGCGTTIRSITAIMAAAANTGFGVAGAATSGRARGRKVIAGAIRPIIATVAISIAVVASAMAGISAATVLTAATTPRPRARPRRRPRHRRRIAAAIAVIAAISSAAMAPTVAGIAAMSRVAMAAVAVLLAAAVVTAVVAVAATARPAAAVAAMAAEAAVIAAARLAWPEQAEPGGPAGLLAFKVARRNASTFPPSCVQTGFSPAPSILVQRRESSRPRRPR